MSRNPGERLKSFLTSFFFSSKQEGINSGRNNKISEPRCATRGVRNIWSYISMT